MSDTMDWAGEFESNDSKDETFQLWGMLWRRKWIVAATTMLGIALGSLYYYQAQPIYQSTAQVLIEPKQPALPIGDGVDRVSSRQYFLAESQKHPIVIQSPEIVGSAIRVHKLDELASLAEAENPLSEIIENLTVVPEIEGLSVYDILYEGTNRNETTQVVDAIIAAHGNFLESTHRDVGRETRELIFKGKEELLRQLTAKEKAYNEFRANAPLMWKDGAGTNLHQERQASIETERASILLKMSQLRSQLDTVQDAIRRRENIDAIFAMAAQALPSIERPVSKVEHPIDRRRDAMLREQATLLPLLMAEEEAAARYGNDHPQVKSFRRQIKQTRVYLDKIQAAEAANANQPDPEHEDLIRAWKQDLIRSYVHMLQQDLQQAQQTADQLDELFNAEAMAAKVLTVHQVRDETFRNDIGRTQQLFESVLKSLDEISLVQDYEGYNYHILSPPSLGRKISPDPLKLFPLAGILGFVFGGGIAYLVDLTDKSFSNPMEISQCLHLPVVGHIPTMSKDESVLTEATQDLSTVLCTAHAPRTPAAEAYRTVRTALFFNARNDRHQVIQVTSPRPGDGKSTLAANLGIAIAQSGKSTLIVDADFRRPSQHRMFGFDKTVGIASVVDGKAEPAEAYQTIPCVENLTVMACGDRPTNPSELLSSQRFYEALAYLREQFDYVLIDTPPLLAVSDPRAVAAQVDGVLLTMRIDKEARPVATRAREILVETGANVVGIVVNGVDNPETGLYYNYGRYIYGYKRYGYGYTYGNYGDDVVDAISQGRKAAEGNGRPETVIESPETRVES